MINGVLRRFTCSRQSLELMVYDWFNRGGDGSSDPKPAAPQPEPSPEATPGPRHLLKMRPWLGRAYPSEGSTGGGQGRTGTRTCRFTGSGAIPGGS